MSAVHPHPSYHFRVDAGFSRIGFTRVLLPRMERDVIRYREGSYPDEFVRELPGLLRLTECVLERGVMPMDDQFFQWLNTVRFGTAERRDLTVALLNEQHEPTTVWRLHNTFPVKLEWSVLDALTSSVLIETLHLSVESMDLQPT